MFQIKLPINKNIEQIVIKGSLLSIVSMFIVLLDKIHINF